MRKRPLFLTLAGIIAAGSATGEITVFPNNPAAYPSYGVQYFGNDLNAAWASIPRPDQSSYAQSCCDWTVIIPAGAYLPASSTYSVQGCTVAGDTKVYQWGATIGCAYLSGTTHTNTVMDGLSSTNNLLIGQLITGPNLLPGTTVAAITGPTSITLSAAATGSATNNYVFAMTGMPISGPGVPAATTIAGAGVQAGYFTSGANGASTVAGSNVVTLQGTGSTATLFVGQTVYTSSGQYLPYTIITGILNGTQFTTQANALATGNNLSLTAGASPYVVLSAAATSTNLQTSFTVQYPQWLKATTALGSQRVTVNYVSNQMIGQAITGTGISPGTTITGIEYAPNTNVGVITLSIAATATGSATLSVTNLGSYFLADLWGRRITNLCMGPVNLGLSDESWILPGNTSSQPAVTTNANPNVTGLTDTSLLFAGQLVYGSNIPSGTTIATITGGTTLTLSGNASAGGATTLTFGNSISDFWTPQPGTDHFTDLLIMPGTTPVAYGVRSGFHWQEYPGHADAWTTHESYTSKTRISGSVRILDPFGIGNNPNQSLVLGDCEVFGNPGLMTYSQQVGTTAIGSSTLTGLTSTTGLMPGQAVSGAGIPADTYILSVPAGGTTLVMTKAATAAASPTITFAFAGSSTLSVDGTLESTVTWFTSFYKSRVRGILNGRAHHELAMVENTEFSGWVGILQYSHIHDSAIKAGMVWTNNSNNFDCVGLTDCQLYSTAAFIGAAAAPLRLDSYTNYWLKSAAAVLDSATPKLVLDDATSATVALTGQTVTIGTTTIFTPASAGTYRISVYANVTTAGTAGTLQVTVGWNDGAAAETANAPLLNLTAVAGGFVAQEFFVKVAAGQAITYAATVAGATGAPVYALNVDVVNVA